MLQHYKKQRVHEEATSTTHNHKCSPSEGALSMSSEEKIMEQATSEEFYAIVLRQEGKDASEVEVLLSSAPYAFYPFSPKEDRAIVTSAHLVKAVERKIRAHRPDVRDWEPQLVYASNPTLAGRNGLEYGARARLDPERRQLMGRERLGVGELRDVEEFFVLVTAPAQQPAEEKVAAAGPDDELFQSICSSVLDDVDGCSYQLPAVFRLPADHPFATGVNERFIPCHPSDPSRPYLLMEGLAPELRDATDNSEVPAVPVRLIDADEKRTLRLRTGGHPVVLLGVSGAGKTRLLCEMLAEAYGLLFIADRGGNGGCADLEDAVTHVQRAVREVPAGLNDEQTQKVLQNNLELALHIFQAVVLARLLLLHVLKQKFGDKLSPGLWLWMQLHPDTIFEQCPAVVKRFRLLWRECRKLSVEFIGEQCLLLSGAILETNRPDKLFCCVDEAQQLLVTLREGFSSKSGHTQRRSCFSALVKSLDGVCSGPLMVGTGIRMAEATKEATTALGGKPGADEKGVQFGRRGHLDPNACRDYILRYLGDDTRQAVNGITEDDLQTICLTLQGRPRFAERVVSRCLEEGSARGVMEVFEKFVSGQVKGEPIPPTLWAQRSKVSIYWALDALHQHLGACRRDKPEPDKSDVMMEFLSVALRYAITGRPQLLTKPEHFQLIEAGMANIDYEQNQSVVSICEPIVVRAASYHFGLLAFENHRLGALVGNPSALGNEFEAFVALALFNKHPLQLSVDAPANVDRVEIPAEFVGEWRLWNPEEAITTGVFECGEYIRLYDVHAPTRELQGSLQAKFKSKPKGSDQVIATTDLAESFTRYNGAAITTHEAVRERSLATYDHAVLPQLRVFVAFPGAVQDQAPVQVIDRNALVLVIDDRNANLVFNPDELSLLRQVYHATEETATTWQPT